MNDTTQSFHYLSPNGDYFEKLFSYSAIKVASLVAFFIASISGLILLFGIVYYERHGRFRYRTVTNQLLSTVAWIGIWFILLIYIPDAIRQMAGPLNKSFCNAHVLLKRFLMNCFLLTLDAIILFRYLFIFRMPNFAIVNDEAVTRCVNISIVMLSAWAVNVFDMSPGDLQFVDFICAGLDPTENKHDIKHQDDKPTKTNILGLIVVVSVVLHVFVNIKIFIYEKNDQSQNAQNIELGTFRNKDVDGEKKDYRTKSNPSENLQNRLFHKGMVDASTLILFCVNSILMAAQLLMRVLLNDLGLSIFNEDKHYWYLLCFKIFGPFGPVLPLLVLSTIIIYYWRNNSLWEFFLRKARDVWIGNSNDIIVV